MAGSSCLSSCEGGYPCAYCVRTSNICEPPKPLPNSVKFVTESYTVQNPAIQPGAQRCQFANGFASATTQLVPLMNGCSPLREVAMALGALEASRRASITSYYGKESPQVAAMNLYGMSIQSLRTKLAEAPLSCRDDILWSIFLMGLFELMSGTLGDQWAQHMRQGLSTILRLTGPVTSRSSLSQTFLDAFRVMEATRAVMYGDGTFLSQDAWLHHYSSPKPRGYSVSDPMRGIATLIIQTASFAKNFFEAIQNIPEPQRLDNPAIEAIAGQGLHFQHTIRNWYQDNTRHWNRSDPYVPLALASYHAPELFHSRNYTFYSCWKDKALPCLSRDEIDTHIDTKLCLAEQILKSAIVPNVLLLFPLRMAGANSIKAEQQSRIIGILEQIYSSGFVVSERIKLNI
ncbi:hypothetical protein PWT90_09464 [Aphanocladium album]|nr:hypothetical protein PWT90_09464 [Aphanocladium album]